MQSVKFLDMAKEKAGLKNDKELADALGRTKAAISQYRSGKSIMDNETCIALALMLNIEPWKIIMSADIDRAEKTGQKSLWEVFSQRMATAASVVLVVNLFLTPTPSEAAPVLKDTQHRLCIMSNRRRNHHILTTIFTWMKRLFSGAALQPATR